MVERERLRRTDHTVDTVEGEGEDSEDDDDAGDVVA